MARRYEQHITILIGLISIYICIPLRPCQIDALSRENVAVYMAYSISNISTCINLGNENKTMWIVTSCLFTKLTLKDARTSFFLPLEFCNFWICYTLWDKTRGNVKINWRFGRFSLLETNLSFWKSGHLREKGLPSRAFFYFLIIRGCLYAEK